MTRNLISQALPMRKQLMTVALAATVVLGIGGTIATAHSEERRDDRRGGDHRDERDRRGYDQRYDRAPPVVYGSPCGWGGCAPPVVYGRGMGIILPNIQLNIR